MTTRNFWLKANIDGRSTLLEGGPAAKDGGFSLEVLIRENGGISDKKIRIDGIVRSDGKLVLVAFGPDGQKLMIETQR